MHTMGHLLCAGIRLGLGLRELSKGRRQVKAVRVLDLPGTGLEPVTVIPHDCCLRVGVGVGWGQFLFFRNHVWKELKLASSKE